MVLTFFVVWFDMLTTVVRKTPGIIEFDKILYFEYGGVRGVLQCKAPCTIVSSSFIGSDYATRREK